MEKNRRGIQSVEIGSTILLELSKHAAPLALKDLANATDMTTSKVHPYMVSFLKVGFATQNESGQYELGPLALHLGLARLRRMDPVKEASNVIMELAEQTGLSVAIAIWGNFGPTIIRLEEPADPLHVNLKAGTVMSISATATGRLFGAYMPPKVIEQYLKYERERYIQGTERYKPILNAEYDTYIKETKLQGISRTKGDPIPGIDALCAPVFDSNGHIVLGILVMGASAAFDSSWDGMAVSSLRAATAEIAHKIGGYSKLPE